MSAVGDHEFTTTSFTYFPRDERRSGIIGNTLLGFPFISLGVGILSHLLGLRLKLLSPTKGRYLASSESSGNPSNYYMHLINSS